MYIPSTDNPKFFFYPNDDIRIEIGGVLTPINGFRIDCDGDDNDVVTITALALEWSPNDPQHQGSPTAFKNIGLVLQTGRGVMGSLLSILNDLLEPEPPGSPVP